MNTRQGFKRQDWCNAHDRPRAECSPEQTHQYQIRLPVYLEAAAERKALSEHISLAALTRRALARETGLEPLPATVRGRNVAILAGTEAVSDRYEVEEQPGGEIVLRPAADFSAEYAQLRADRDTALTMKQELFAVALGNATEENPVTGDDLRVATDTVSSNRFVPALLAAVDKAGAVGRRKDGRTVLWWPFPGADIRAAIRGESQGAAVAAQAAADGKTPAPRPRKPARQATRAGKGKNAATRKTPSGAAAPEVRREILDSALEDSERIAGRERAERAARYAEAAAAAERAGSSRLRYGSAAHRDRMADAEISSEPAAAKEAPPKRRAAPREQAPAAARPPVAAKSQQDVITELKTRVPDLVTASELTGPAPAMFRPGPDAGCVHENMRLRKGVCPDCKQWVTK